MILALGIGIGTIGGTDAHAMSARLRHDITLENRSRDVVTVDISASAMSGGDNTIDGQRFTSGKVQIKPGQTRLFVAETYYSATGTSSIRINQGKPQDVLSWRDYRMSGQTQPADQYSFDTKANPKVRVLESRVETNGGQSMTITGKAHLQWVD